MNKNFFQKKFFFYLFKKKLNDDCLTILCVAKTQIKYIVLCKIFKKYIIIIIIISGIALSEIVVALLFLEYDDKHLHDKVQNAEDNADADKHRGGDVELAGLFGVDVGARRVPVKQVVPGAQRVNDRWHRA